MKATGAAKNPPDAAKNPAGAVKESVMDATQDHHTGHGHDHRSASRRSLSISLALIMAYMVVEVVGGLMSGSLALLADAGHMLTDGAAIGLALLAIWVCHGSRLYL